MHIVKRQYIKAVMYLIFSILYWVIIHALKQWFSTRAL